MKTDLRGVVAVVLLACPWLAAQGQTNGLAFRGCRAGDTVAFQAAKPMVMSTKAVLLTITESNVTVACGLDRYVVARDEVVQIEKTGAPGGCVVAREPTVPVTRAAPVLPPAPEAERPRLAELKSLVPPPGMEALLGMVQSQVLGNFSNDENYGQATNYFASTMRDYLSGKTSVADLQAKATEVLSQMDQYRPERQKDPQYEPFVQMLRSFVENQKVAGP
jgi:hypothetical protein